MILQYPKTKVFSKIIRNNLAINKMMEHNYFQSFQNVHNYQNIRIDEINYFIHLKEHFVKHILLGLISNC